MNKSAYSNGLKTFVLGINLRNDKHLSSQLLRLDIYIYDYLVKRKYNISAKTFQAEAQVSNNHTAIDAPGGFLFEWWSIFWDIFIARYKRQGTSTAESYNEFAVPSSSAPLICHLSSLFLLLCGLASAYFYKVIRLDIYIYDYLVKRKYNISAKTFQAEAQVSNNHTAIDAPGGFLFEWWSIFWDIFIARYKRQGTSTAESYNEGQIIKAQEQQHQHQQHQKPQQQRQKQMQLQEVILKRQFQQQEQQYQQQRRDETQLQKGIASDNSVRQNPEVFNALARKMYEEGLKLLVQKDHLGDADIQVSNSSLMFTIIALIIYLR
ncbi:unnamed protein product [Ilex paraguariensis]|uniref:LisH domain-containing protein n=1 Tax=Ilex paraguariensis TaxID=185542 RepID=A0ABC8SB31_9AQUA